MADLLIRFEIADKGLFENPKIGVDRRRREACHRHTRIYYLIVQHARDAEAVDHLNLIEHHWSMDELRRHQWLLDHLLMREGLNLIPVGHVCVVVVLESVIMKIFTIVVKIFVIIFLIKLLLRSLLSARCDLVSIFQNCRQQYGVILFLINHQRLWGLH